MLSLRGILFRDAIFQRSPVARWFDTVMSLTFVMIRVMTMVFNIMVVRVIQGHDMPLNIHKAFYPSVKLDDSFSMLTNVCVHKFFFFVFTLK